MNIHYLRFCVRVYVMLYVLIMNLEFKELHLLENEFHYDGPFHSESDFPIERKAPVTKSLGFY